jgi:hypothetical protein
MPRVGNNAEGRRGEDDHQGTSPDIDGQEHDEPRLLPSFQAKELRRIVCRAKERVDGFDRITSPTNLPPRSLGVSHQKGENERCFGAKGDELAQSQPPLLVPSLAAIEVPVEKVMPYSTRDSDGQTNDHGPLAMEKSVPEGGRSGGLNGSLAGLEDARGQHHLGSVGLHERVDQTTVFTAENGRGGGIRRLEGGHSFDGLVRSLGVRVIGCHLVWQLAISRGSRGSSETGVLTQGLDYLKELNGSKGIPTRSHCHKRKAPRSYKTEENLQKDAGLAN